MNYHFVFCPVRRKKARVNAVKERLEALILEKARQIGCQVVELAIQPDHVHLFIVCPPTLAPHQVMHRMKGYPSRVLRQAFLHLLKLPWLWTRRYWVSTADKGSSESIQRYIEAQEK